VLAMRPTPNPFAASRDDSILSGEACYPARIYDPAATPLQSVDDLKKLITRANTEKKALWVSFADLTFLRMRDPALVNLLEDKALFKMLPTFHGIHTQPGRWVFHYLGQKETLP